MPRTASTRLTERSTKRRVEFAQAPYKINDRRSSSGYVSANNELIEASKVDVQRKQPTTLNRDLHRILSSSGRENLVTYSRWLYSNFPQVHGMLLEQANLSVGSFQPQFYGADKAWGLKAEEVLEQWHKIMDYRGWPYDYETFTMFQVLGPLRCGDIGTMLVTNRDGYPYVQLIPAHRIGSSPGEMIVLGGRYDGYQIIDGVIVNDFGQAIAYKVWKQQVGLNDPDYIPAYNMILSFYPEYPDQCRGIPSVSAGRREIQDAQESRWNELLAQKALSAISIVEANETGEADTAKSVIRTAATQNTDGTQNTLAYEELAGGTIRYIRSNSGSSISTVQHQRPGATSMEFLETCVRDAFQSAEWDYYFSVNPSKIGSGSLRLIVDRVNRVIRKRRIQPRKVCARVDAWSVAKHIQLGLLPQNDDWWKWDYQGPADMTADKKYDSDVDLQEHNAGFRPLQDVAARRNLYWEDVQDQQIREKLRLAIRTREIAAEMGASPEDIAAVNGQAATEPEPNRTRREPQEPDEEEEQEGNEAESEET